MIYYKERDTFYLTRIDRSSTEMKIDENTVKSIAKHKATCLKNKRKRKNKKK